MSSSNVENVFYNEKENILTVRCQSGGVIQYRPINPENYTELILSGCLSSAVHRAIRQPNIVGTVLQRGH